MIKWIKNNLIALALATSKVENNALNNNGNLLSNESEAHQKNNSGSLKDALLNGVITKEVEDLRWRMYKVLEAADNDNKQVIRGYLPPDEDGFEAPIMGILSKSAALKKVVLDDFDSYPLEFLVNNDTETLNSSDNLKLQLDGTKVEPSKKLEIVYDSLTKFKVENFCTKLNIRTIDEKTKLGELYFSAYHDGYSPAHALFIAELTRMYDSQRYNYMFDIKSIGFVSSNDMGVKDNLGFLYNVNKYDKIIKFNGYFIVKFILDVELENVNIFEKYRMGELDQKYNDKTPKKTW